MPKATVEKSAPANDPTWGDHTLTYDLHEARVVPVLHEGGGAIVEQHPRLKIIEGRFEPRGTDG
jgi:hypothetical protein